MLLKNDLNNINSIVKSNNVLAQLEERYCYSKDALNQSKTSKTPDLVVFVETISEIQQVLKYANEHKIPVICRGAGTNMVGACTTPNGGIVLNFSKMNKIIDINPVNMTAIVQPGVVLGDLKSKVEDLGLFFPPDPSNYKVSTVGGAIAQSSGGAMSFKYGTIKDYVLSLKVVTADGKLLMLGSETHKNSVGYHLNQLMIGSEGTLAIVVEAVLKLIPKPISKVTIGAYFKEIKSLISSVNEILASQIYPSAIEFMDSNSLKTVNDYLNINLKDEKMNLLLIDIDGYENDLSSQMEKAVVILKKYNALEIKLSGVDDDIDLIWQARRVSYAASTRLAPDVISDDIIVPRESLLKMIEECNKICDKYNLTLCLVGHIGDGNLHPQIALDLENESEYKRYLDAKSEIYEKVVSLGGTISAEHGVGVEKMSYINYVIDINSIEYMKLIKKVFDPNGILNPGKIFN